MSAYKETWVEKAVAGTVIALTAIIAMLPVPKVNLASVAPAALTVLLVLATLGALLVLRTGLLANALLTRCKLTWFVAASAALGALLGKHDWLTSALAWALLAAGAWLALLLTLMIGSLVSRIVLSPAFWLARQLGFEPVRPRGGWYASPAPRRYSAPARYSGAGYAAAAGAATGYAAGQAWDMLDPMNPMNPIPTPAASPVVELNNPTTGMPMLKDTPVDAIGHTYCDPAPIFEPAPIYDYSSNCGGGSFGGGGFDF